jgi:hypothetical protein
VLDISNFLIVLVHKMGHVCIISTKYDKTAAFAYSVVHKLLHALRQDRILWIADVLECMLEKLSCTLFYRWGILNWELHDLIVSHVNSRNAPICTVVVWCAACAAGIVGTIVWDRNLIPMLHTFWLYTDYERTRIYFQPDGATAHTANNFACCAQCFWWRS